MLYWLQFPYVRIAISFILGILAFKFFPSDVNPMIWILVIALITAAILVIRKYRFFSLNYLAGLGVFTAVAILGYTLSWRSHQRVRDDHFSTRHFDFFMAETTSLPTPRGNFARVNVKILAVNDVRKGWTAAGGGILAYLPVTYQDSLVTGQKLLLRGDLVEIRGPMNPLEFDYRSFMAGKGISHQLFAKEGQVMILEEQNSFRGFLSRLRVAGLDGLEERIPDERNLNTAKAILLGYRSDLDKELRDAFAHAGAMHILAISGLHIGIIYLFLSFTFSPIARMRHGIWVKSGAILGCLWIFALVVGLTPSVFRAVVMFSILAVGQSFSRSTNIYNSIALAAFILLVISPESLFDIGFQLSFLALTGIVFLHGYFNSWWNPSNKLLQWVWSLTSVSIAAQLATLPLSLYYFHNFPTLFFISNLLVIPAAFIILVSGFILILSSVVGIEFISTLASFALDVALSLMNGAVIWIESIPYSFFESIYLDTYQVFLLYLLVVVALATFLRKKVSLYYTALGLSIAVLVSFHFETGLRSEMKLIAIYNIRGASQIDLIHKGNIAEYFRWYGQESDEPVRAQDYTYQTTNFRIAYAGTSTADSAAYKESSLGTLLPAFGAKILHIDRPWEPSITTMKKLKVDLVLVSNNSISDFTQFRQVMEATTVIFDASNASWYLKKIYGLENHGFIVHNVNDFGGMAMVLDKDGSLVQMGV